MTTPRTEPVREVSVRTRRTAVAASFFVQGLLFISLTLRLPQVKEVFGLSDLGLAGLMLLLVLLAGAGSVGAEVVAHHRDSAVAVRCALGLVAAGILLLGLALAVGNLAVLVAAMAVYGLGLGGNDAASNMQAVAVEHRLGRPVMPSFHAAWTAGGLLATLGAIALPQLGFGVASLVLALAPLATLLRAPFLRWDHGATAADRHALGVPWRTIVLVGLGLVLFYTVDTAVTAWGPVYLSSDDVFTDPPTSPSMYALATLPYLLATLLARWAGDATTARHGAPTVVRVGALTAFVGLAIVVLAPPALWQVGVVGFFVVGLGVAVVAPLAFSAAARVAGRDGPEDAATHRARVDAVVARFNQFNYAGALLGSVLTGVVGTSTLRGGFAVPMVLVLGLLPLARHFATPGADG